MVYFASFSDSSRVLTPGTLSRPLEAQNAERTSEINGFLEPWLNVFLLAHFCEDVRAEFPEMVEDLRPETIARHIVAVAPMPWNHDIYP